MDDGVLFQFIVIAFQAITYWHMFSQILRILIWFLLLDIWYLYLFHFKLILDIHILWVFFFILNKLKVGDLTKFENCSIFVLLRTILLYKSIFDKRAAKYPLWDTLVLDDEVLIWLFERLVAIARQNKLIFVLIARVEI